MVGTADDILTEIQLISIKAPVQLDVDIAFRGETFRGEHHLASNGLPHVSGTAKVISFERSGRDSCDVPDAERHKEQDARVCTEILRSSVMNS